MDLSVEIDRGDVWYDPKPRARKITRRPAFILYVTDAGQRRPLVRWSTTIGGWKHESRAGGGTVDRWKESPVGPRVWRTMYVAPTWLPPDTTPDRELVHTTAGHTVLARELFGPSYRSAYGLLMLVHEQAVPTRRGTVWRDEGVRVRGSGSVAGIFDGQSHGCHRVPPLLALRLGGFLLAHRAYVRHGEARTLYVRTVREKGTFPVRITTRGYQIELTPPVPVEVLPGQIRSKRKVPPAGSRPSA